MPSSLIFAGLVVLWLLILVPAVARHQQVVARPSVAALSGRVLERPQRRHPTEEVDYVHDTDEPVRRGGAGATTVAEAVATRTEMRAPIQGSYIPESRAAEDDGYAAEDDGGYSSADHSSADHSSADHSSADHDRERWERPAPRYRPGRGGFDPEAAALTARAQYAFRQRVVLGMLVGVVVTAVVAVFAAAAVWWLHVLVDVALVGYLVYLRRQVRMEESIRDRRAARMAGTHRPRSADDPELDEWARRGQEAAIPVAETDDDDDLVEESPARAPRAPGPLPEPIRVTAPNDEEPALPRLVPAPPPPLPAGTTVVDGDLDDPSLHDLDPPARLGPNRLEHRRAVGE